MECVTPPRKPHSSTGKPLLHNHNNTMKKWQDFVFKLARGHPLPPPAETLLRNRLHRFVSDYITPDHPPYSAMIENALQELNEKGGSSEESISRYLEKKYDKLPWARTALLKHHLEKACESGDIVVTRAKKYRLAGSLNLSTKSKSKLQQSRARWECKKQQNNPLKIRFIKKSNQKRGERVEVNKKYQECDENGQRLTENGVHNEDKQDQEKSFPSCIDVEKRSRSDPSILLTEPPGMIAAANEKEFPEEARSKLENCPSAIVESDIWAAHSPEHQEKEQSEHGQPEPVTPEKPPDFESFRVDIFPELGSTEPEPASGREVTGSTPVLGQLTCRSRRYSEPRAVNITPSELVTPSKAGEYDSLQEETFQGKLRRSTRGHPVKPEVSKDTNTVDVLPPECSPNVRPLAVGRRLDRPLKQRPRGHPAKPEVAKDINTDFTQSGKEAEFTSMHEKLDPSASKLPLQELKNKPRRGSPPKRRSARLLK